MSAALATAALPDQPDPTPDPATGHAPAASRTGRLLGLLRKLVDYGKHLSQSLQQDPAGATARTATLHFGGLGIVLILMRIARGLRLAAGLEARLVRHKLREAPVHAPAARLPSPAQPASTRARRPRPELQGVPTAEEIAEALRHRPVGAVIAEICADLGIVPAHPLWGEVMTVVAEFGQGLSKLCDDMMDRLVPLPHDFTARLRGGRRAHRLSCAAAAATGPP